MKKTIVLAKHIALGQEGKEIYGTGSPLEDFLRKKKVDYLFIKHPLLGNACSRVEGFFENKRIEKTLGSRNSSFLLLKSWQELKITFQAINELKKPIDLFIGIDPLNAFFGLLAKKAGKVKKVIFYTADYAIKRFENLLLNAIYHWIDRLVIKKADWVWNVSSKITELRKKQGVGENRNFFVPNSICFNETAVRVYEEINQQDLVLVSGLFKTVDFSLAIRAVKQLSQKYPDIRLLIIGEGDYKKELEQLTKNLGAEKNIVFLGRKKHQEVLEILSRSAFGIALYTDEYAWTRFGDSMKVREYLACGLPVIMTDVPSTADDIKRAGAGYVIGLDQNDLIKGLDELLGNKKKYLAMRKNALNLARKFDITTILTTLLKDYL